MIEVERYWTSRALAPGRHGAGTQRIRSFVRLNLIVLAVALAWLIFLATAIPVAAGQVSVIALLLVLLSAGLFNAWVLAGRSAFVAAVVAVAVFNWVAVLMATALVPVLLVVLPVTVLLPALLAAPFLHRSQLSSMLGSTILVMAATGLVGIASPGIGLDTAAPEWTVDATAVFFVPVTAGLAMFLAWQSHHILVIRSDELAASRRRLVSAGARQRRQIERDLNDGPRHRIDAITRDVDEARRVAATDRVRAADRLADVAEALQDTSTQLRELAHGISPAELAEHGLQRALRSAALAGPVPVEVVVVDPTGRYRPDVENAVHFCCVQAIDNARRHAGSEARVTVLLDGTDGLSFAVRDVGVGCDDARLQAGAGIGAMTDRLQTVGGRLRASARLGEGVQVHGHIPRAQLAEPQPAAPSGPVLRAVVSGLAVLWRFLRACAGGAKPRGPDHHIEQGLRSQLVTTLGAAAASPVIGLFVPNPWLFVTAALSVVTAIGLFFATRAAQRGHTTGALVAETVMMWFYALAFTALVPVVLMHTAIAVMVPIVLTIPHLRNRFGMVIAGTTVFIVGTVLAGRLADGVGIDAGAPGWLVEAVGLTCVLVSSVIFLYMVSLSQATLADRAEELRASRARVVAEVDRERHRIERDLHDGAQQRLVSAAIQARVAQRLLTTTDQASQPLLTVLAEEIDAASAELRDLCLGIYPAELAENGIVTALLQVAARSPIHTAVDAVGVGRHPTDVEVNVYFCCLESLQNCIKHAGDRARVRIKILERRATLVFEVSDDGPGADLEVLRAGRGYIGMSDRVAAIGGVLQAANLPGAGVMIRGLLPLSATRDQEQ